ncbi:aminotransferase class I/II-fold pyridoxal phosphate-dependent enzyme [Paenibacillus rhizophilus]|uniref:Aminotransferase class I/II-fold pyridoxal phosphate-dependent enzyme n=1 Tax=Paenibacillus rhizophilus TaxID=1850366 RepID=A0A3N9Q067_9BACL|nr:aminotransferase class I/II-fold pyridoxal phosphate-dependent enzyme [Paenibacillus rhizophilus]RQW12052.1 aminotransferase class I/II-fold pyridoxal phosphate-dependent enzyme [Paenibacillus rhizophilus]
MANFKPSAVIGRLPEHYFRALKEKVADYRSRGIDIIDLSSGNPDQPTPEHIVRSLKEAADRPENHGYPPFYGKKSTLEAIAAFYKREYDVDLDPETEIAVFHGSSTGIMGIAQTLLGTGDVLLTANPAYPPYYAAAALAGAEVHVIPVYEKDGFLPDYRTVPEEIVRRVKLLLLNYPNNPTGAVATRAFFEQSIALAAEHHFPVVNDFAYGAFGFDGHKPISLLQIPGGKEYGVEINTLSKTYNMAGWRFGFAVGNASVIAALKLYHTHAYSTIFGAVQDAAAAALLGPQGNVKQLVDCYERRRDSLVSKLRSIGWDVSAPKGTFFAWFKVPEGYRSREFAEKLLEEAHVAVAPGEGFGSQGDSYVRIGLVNSEEQLLEAAERIAKTGIFHRSAVQSSEGSRRG